MNQRNVDYISRNNPRKLYPIVDNKLITKKYAKKHNIAVPELIDSIQYQFEIKNLETILKGIDKFVIKPAQGAGGKGILVITDRKGDSFYKPSGMEVSFDDIKRHISNILSGLHSLGGKTDVAMFEKLVDFDPVFEPYSYEGVPDVRMIVYQGYPVMAMLRCSTHASDGKANLHQGAVGVGIDIKTGRSLFAVQNGRNIERHPDTNSVFSELQVPHWDAILPLSAACYEMTGMGYLGCDIVIDKHKGALILEVNARPGLAIQIANNKGLLDRLNYVEHKAPKSASPEERAAFSVEHFGAL
ncbi:alpha-L-glutamate ligase-like protein [Alkalimarinus sediminis]|uniref:Alpha-L-glutamate ligase-like protein n=2 Tax=Alkalimarinus sediminis TaxID=1632866 RepID=A0A9E8KPY6_9ALTE|nr:alpha-L-glutamate ligase-like protein [Alkalimarinus sediminis]